MAKHNLRDAQGRFREKPQHAPVFDMNRIQTGTLHTGSIITSNNAVWTNWYGNSTVITSVTPAYIQYGTTGTAGTHYTTNTYAPQQNDVWMRWQNNEYVTYTQAEYVQARHDLDRLRMGRDPVLTPEERQRALDREQTRREEQSRVALARRQRMEGAQERALELLEMILTPEEKIWRVNNDGNIMVRAESGRMYVIQTDSYHGVHGNVYETDEHGCRLGRICVAPRMHDHVDGTIPLADGWIGQYLYIKHQEELVRSTGNWSYRQECLHKDVPLLGQRGSSIAA